MIDKCVFGIFSGIGGIELGLAKGGFESVALCEIDKAAKHVLETNFPGVNVFDDVRNIKKVPNGTRIVTAGFPCQDLSSSGKKSGISGVQSFLIDEVFRLLSTSKNIDWVILENVKFMLHLNKGSAMDYITNKFEELGYNWAYRVVNTESFGLPQRRHRVIFIASKCFDPRGVLFVDDTKESPNKNSSSDEVPRGFYWTEGRYSTGMAHNSVPPLKAGSTIGIPSPPAIMFPDGTVGTPSILDAERLQGFPENWTKPSEDIMKPSHRWKLIGNSVSVPIFHWISHRIKNPLDYDGTNDPILIDSKWPNAAWSIKKIRKQSTVSEWPKNEEFIGLNEFLKYPLKPLSLKAANGYLSRAKSGNLSHPDGFISKLEEYTNNI